MLQILFLTMKDMALICSVKGPSSQSYGFSSSHVWMWELGYKESWVLKNWCFWSMVLEKTLESPLECKEIQPVSPKGNQSWILIGKTNAEAETPIFWPPDAKTTQRKRPWCLMMIEDRKRRGRQRMRWLDSIIKSMAMILSKLLERVKTMGVWSAAVPRVAKSQTQFSDWKKQNWN